MKVRGPFIFLLLAAVFLFMTGAAHTGTGGNYHEIAAVADASLLVFDADGSSSNIVLAGDSPVYIRINENGDIESSFGLPNPPVAAYIYGGSLYTYSPVRGRILMNEIDLDDGSVANSFYIRTSPEELLFLCGDALGNSYYVKKEEPAVIYRCGPDGISSPLVQAGGEINYCGVIDDSLVYSCDGRIFMASVYDASVSAGIPSVYTPARFFSVHYMVDVNGVFCRVSSAAEPVYESGVPNGYGISNGRNVILHSKDENDCFYTASTEPAVTKTDGSGTVLENYRTEPNMIGVNANGVLINDAGSIQFAPYASFTMSADPTPTPDVFPEDVRISGSYLIVAEGKTVHELSQQLKTTVYLGGNAVTAGSCVTGMTLSFEETDYTVVLPGDVNGTGTLNTADIKLIQSYLIGSGRMEEPYLFAADYSENGSVGTEDLAMIARNIA